MNGLLRRRVCPDSSPLNILLTGANGFIGLKLSEILRVSGHNVIGLCRGRTEQGIECNLLDAVGTVDAIRQCGKIDAVIHAAAIAHGQIPPPGYDASSVNVCMVENLINAISGKIDKFIFLSSVAVLSPKDIVMGADLSRNPKPVSAYGRGKLKCEDLLFNASIPELHVLRLPPVYDDKHLEDVAKRVIIMGMSGFKMRLYPAPKYSFLNVNLLAKRTLNLTTNTSKGRWLHMITDPEPYSQHQIAEWFRGVSIPIPVALFIPIKWMSTLIPTSMGLKIRELYTKLFESVVFNNCRLRVDI